MRPTDSDVHEIQVLQPVPDHQRPQHKSVLALVLKTMACEDDTIDSGDTMQNFAWTQKRAIDKVLAMKVKSTEYIVGLSTTLIGKQHVHTSTCYLKSIVQGSPVCMRVLMVID